MLHRIGQYALVLAAAVVINFALPRLMPGDPTDRLTGTDLDLAGSLDQQTRERLLSYYGLDKPLAVQFVRYLEELSHLDLGYAYYYGCPVSQLIWERLPWTLLVVGGSLLLATALGLGLGSLAAYRQGTALDKLLVSGLVWLRAVPPYLLGMLAIVVLSVKLSLFPLGGAAAPFAQYGSVWSAAGDIAAHAALPVLVLMLGELPMTFLVMRNSMVSVLGENYMLAARAKGLTRARRLFRYGMRNALLPLYTRLGLRLGTLFGGAIFVETVFNYPGIGRLVYDASLVHDYPVLQGIFLLIAAAVVAANLLVDSTYRLLDPRAVESHE